ncbi:hypothetical protein K6106_20670 [Pseudomonas fluorescens]|nr:hypothetical protein K6106_20670 [Pseudomonas fluorescens]
MQKSLIALSTLSVLLIANTASAAITWPAEQTYEESLQSGIWYQACENSSQERMFRRINTVNPDGSENIINKGNGVYIDNKSGDGFEPISKCYGSKDRDLEKSKIIKSKVESISQKCENPFDTGIINKRRQFTEWNSDRVSSNFKTNFIVTISNTCDLNETKVFDNPFCATKNQNTHLAQFMEPGQERQKMAYWEYGI